MRGATDLGLLTVQPGATVIADLQGDWVPLRRRDAYELELRDATWNTVRCECPDTGENGGRSSFTGLWPDTWTVTLRQGDNTLYTTNVVLRGTETVRVDATWRE